MKTKGITTFVSAVICSALLLVTLLGWNTVSPTSAQEPPAPTIAVSNVSPAQGTIGTVVSADVVLVAPSTRDTKLTVAVGGDVVETFSIGGMAVGDVRISQEGTAAITLKTLVPEAPRTYTYAVEFTAQKVGAGFTVAWTRPVDIYDPYEDISASSTTPNITLEPQFGISVNPSAIEWCANEDGTLVSNGIPELTVTLPKLSDNIISPTLKITANAKEVYNGDPNNLPEKLELAYDLPASKRTVTANLTGDLKFTLPNTYTVPNKPIELGSANTTYDVTECTPPSTPEYELVIEAPQNAFLYNPFDVKVWVKDGDGKPVTAQIGPLSYEQSEAEDIPFAVTMPALSNQAEGKFKAKPLVEGTFNITGTATVDGKKLEGAKPIKVTPRRPGQGKNRGIAFFLKGKATVNGFTIDFNINIKIPGQNATVAQTTTLVPADNSTFIVDWDDHPFVATPENVQGNEDKFLPASSVPLRLVPAFINVTILDPNDETLIGETAPYEFTLGEGVVAQLSNVMSDTKIISPSAQLTILGSSQEFTPTLATDMYNCTTSSGVCGTRYDTKGVPITTLNYFLDSDVNDFGMVVEQRGPVFLPLIRQ